VFLSECLYFGLVASRPQSTPLILVIDTPNRQRVGGGSRFTFSRQNSYGQPILPKSFLFYLDNNSHAQANSGFRMLRGYAIWLHLEPHYEHAIKDSHLRPIQAFTDILKRRCG
jgi:hypothetical protein